MADILKVEKEVFLPYIMNHSDGEVAYCVDTKKYKKYVNGKWEDTEMDVNLENSNIPSLTLYDLNKMAISQMKPLSKEELAVFNEELDKWQKEDKNFYLLYGKEIGYFTLFMKNTELQEYFGDLVIECCESVGPIHAYNIEDEMIEIWVECAENEVTHLGLFNYDTGVVEYNG